MPEAVAPYFCVVCGEGVDAKMSAECNWCDARFHLNQRNDVDAKDCGQVWIDEQYLATPFYSSWRMTAELRLAGHRVNRKRVQEVEAQGRVCEGGKIGLVKRHCVLL